MRKRRILAVGLILGLLFIMAGCHHTIRNESQKIAKNWFSVIRGAQVFPINPLRGDLKPGDIILVRQTLEQQSNAFKRNGYMHLTPGYASLKMAATNSTAAIPSFSFNVDRSSGAQLNLPVKGIPVGLGMVATEKVAVSLAITDVTTSSVEVLELYTALKKWAKEDGRPELLKEQAKASPDPTLLRVISRVYYTKGVTASITALDSKGADIEVGGAIFSDHAEGLKRILPGAIDSSNATKRYEQLATELNKNIPITVDLPGGQAQFMKSSKNSISMSEKFDKPLAIGYVAIDVILYKNGTIGAPLLYLESLDGFQMNAVQVEDMAEIKFYQQYISDLPDKQRQKEIIDQIAGQTGIKTISEKRSVNAFWKDMDDLYLTNIAWPHYNDLLAEIRTLCIKE